MRMRIVMMARRRVIDGAPMFAGDGTGAAAAGDVEP